MNARVNVDIEEEDYYSCLRNAEDAMSEQYSLNSALTMMSRMKMMMAMRRMRMMTLMMTRTMIISGCVMRRVPWMHPPSSGRYQLQTDSLYFPKDQVAAYIVDDDGCDDGDDKDDSSDNLEDGNGDRLAGSCSCK